MPSFALLLTQLFALLALQAGLIRESVCTSLISVAVVTSMAAGPLIRALHVPEDQAG